MGLGVKRRLAALVGLLLALVTLIYAYVQWRNTNFIYDPNGQVAFAAIDGLDQTPFAKIADDWFIQYPTPEGHFDVRCKSGQQLEAGYVTGFSSATLVMGPECTMREIRR